MSQHLSGSQTLHSGWGPRYILGCKGPKDKEHLALFQLKTEPSQCALTAEKDEWRPRVFLGPYPWSTSEGGD